MPSVVLSAPVVQYTLADDKMPALRQKLWNEMLARWNESTCYTLELAQSYTKRFKNDPFGWCILGSCLSRIHRHDEGILALRHGIRLAEPKHRSPFYIQMGHLYRDMGKHHTSERWYRMALKTEPKPKQTTMLFLGVSLFIQGPTKFPEAITTLKNAIKISPASSDEACFNLAGIYASQKKYALSAKYYRKAIQIDPNYKSAKTWLQDIERAQRIASSAGQRALRGAAADGCSAKL